MKNVLIVGISDNEGFKDASILNYASKLKHNIFVLKPIKSAYWFERYVKKENVIVFDPQNVLKAVSDIAVFCKKHNIKFDAILTFKEHFVLQASIIAQAFGCIHTPINAIFHSSSNKLLLREHYNKLKDDSVIKSDIDILSDFDSPEQIQNDKVIKPIYGSSSCAVQKISKGTNIKDIKAFLIDSLETKFHYDINRTFLLEDYISGKAFSVDGIVQNKKIKFAGINEYTYAPLPYFIQTGNIIPSTLGIADQKRCYNFVKKIIKQLGLNNCPFHSEIILKDSKLYLIEIACRMPGGKIPRGYELAYGFNFVEQVINLYLGENVSFKKTTNFQVIQKGVHLFNNCIIHEVTIQNNTLKQLDFEQVTQAGEHNTYPINNKPIYYYAVQESDLETATRKCREIEKSIQIIHE